MPQQLQRLLPAALLFCLYLPICGHHASLSHMLGSCHTGSTHVNSQNLPGNGRLVSAGGERLVWGSHRSRSHSLQ